MVNGLSFDICLPVRKSKKSTEDVQAPRSLYPPVTIMPVVQGGVILEFIP